MEELQEFIACEKNPPAMDDEMRGFILKEREELSGEFCRGCGYCMPCPVGIKINDCARMSLMIRRAPTSVSVSYTHLDVYKRQALSLVRVGLVFPHRQTGIEQQNTLLRPFDQTAVIRRVDTQIVLHFFEDIHQ